MISVSMSMEEFRELQKSGGVISAPLIEVRIHAESFSAFLDVDGCSVQRSQSNEHRKLMLSVRVKPNE